APIPSKQRHTNITPLIERIASHAYQNGLSNAQISQILNLAIRCKTLDQASLTKLFENLYPSSPVSAKIVLRVIGSLGASKSKPSPAIQHLLAHWLVSVHGFLENPGYITRFYSVLFDCLELLSIRRPICHLLCYLTRRKHVTPARVRVLLELIRSAVGDERELSELLRVYKSYYPDIIVGDMAVPRRRAVFRPLDSEWFERLRDLRMKNSEYDSDSMNSTLTTTVEKYTRIDRGGVKRSKIEIVIPILKTAQNKLKPSSQSLEEMRSVRDFVWGFDKIELPCQVISILRDPMPMRYMQLVQNEDAVQRLSTWLEAAFANEIEMVEEASGRFTGVTLGLIEALLEFAQFTKTLPETAQTFVKRLLSLSTDSNDREKLLELMPYLEIHDEDDLTTLTQIEPFIANNNPRSRIRILHYFSSLARYWATIIRSKTRPQSEPPLTQLIDKTESLIFAISGSLTSFPPTERTLLSISILQLYSTLAEIYSHAPTNPTIRLTVPPAALVYQLIFTPTLTHISSMSSVLSKYKIAFEESVAAQKQGRTSSPERNTRPKPYPVAMVSQFNGYVMDTCNLLWRNRALNSEDPNAVGCHVPKGVMEEYKRYLEELTNVGSAYRYQLSSVFSLSYSSTMSASSAACFREIWKEAKQKDSDANGDGSGGDDSSAVVPIRQPVTQRSLSALKDDEGISVGWQEYRLRVLDWMDERGCTGIGELMRSTMKALRKSL
ncbi:hypothetical protein KEM56_001453, partial [Ascosphaera pollenicola]